MRRHLLALTLLAAAPFEASANTAFCEALNQLVSAAQSRFDWLPPGRHLIPGSIDERHGVVQRPDGEPRGVIVAVMYRQNGPVQANVVRQRFDTLQREVGGCLPNATTLDTMQGAGATLARWQTPYADIGLRRVDGGAEVPETVIELSVASRW